jgi:hypothetical protein
LEFKLQLVLSRLKGGTLNLFSALQLVVKLRSPRFQVSLASFSLHIPPEGGTSISLFRSLEFKLQLVFGRLKAATTS